MTFQVSPGVNVSEIDLTTIVPAVSTTEGAIAGPFRWGPCYQRVLVDSEVTLVKRFQKPNNQNAETFFTAASFLAYGNKLYVVRTVNQTTSGNSASALNSSANGSGVLIKNEDDYELNFSSGNTTYGEWVARYPGAIGNSLKVSVCHSANAFQQTVFGAFTGNASAVIATFTDDSQTAVIETANAAQAAIMNSVFTVGDIVRIGNGTLGIAELRLNTAAVSGANVVLTFDDPFDLGANLVANSTTIANTTLDQTFTRNWEFWSRVDRAPGTSDFVASLGGGYDEMHIVVVDEDGLFTGSNNSVIEVFSNVSKASDAQTENGSTNYYKNVINQRSQYVYWMGHATTGTNYGNSAFGGTAFTAPAKPTTRTLASGNDGTTNTNALTEANIVGLDDVELGYDLFANPEEIDVSLILQGKARGGSNATALGNYIIDNICETRKDCVALISPDYDDVVNNVGDELDDILAFRSSLRSSSYAIVDSGYKYMYDKYSDVYRYIPLNGDIGGTIVRTDILRDAWWSPAGLNRGHIKNIVKLAYNPAKADRDQLYKADVNPVCVIPGQGVVLFGDKTALGKPSAFDRINVRRLFIVLEKAIATAAKFTLFEFNDSFTRAQFKNLVEPFLRDVQGRRGIYDFRVVCDETNNTPEVIDRNEFVGDIYIKPARSINFIQLNFVAVRTGVEFDEIVGKF